MWFWSKTALLVRRDAGVAGRAGCNSSGFLPKELCVPLCRVICDKNIGGDCAAQGASRSVSAALRSLPAMGLPLLAARSPWLLRPSVVLFGTSFSSGQPSCSCCGSSSSVQGGVALSCPSKALLVPRLCFDRCSLLGSSLIVVVADGYLSIARGSVTSPQGLDWCRFPSPW